MTCAASASVLVDGGGLGFAGGAGGAGGAGLGAGDGLAMALGSGPAAGLGTGLAVVVGAGPVELAVADAVSPRSSGASGGGAGRALGATPLMST